MSFNKKLKELRLQNKMSQEKLAIKLDIATSTYINYETGKKYPSVELLARMAKLFNVSIAFLMDEQNESIVNAKAQDGKCGKHRAEQLVEEIIGLLTGDKLSETEKDAVIEALQEACLIAKNKSK